MLAVFETTDDHPWRTFRTGCEVLKLCDGLRSAITSTKQVREIVADARKAARTCCFVAGTLLFSGSLYAMTFTGLRALGAITPLGGVCFLAGWLLLAVGASRL